MSCTEIYGFDKNGNAYLYAEIKNAWRGGMAIWRCLEQKYLPPYRSTYGPCLRTSNPGAIEEIWDLQDWDTVSETDKICLHTTFDHALAKKEDIPKIIAAFRQFEGETSLKEQAAVLKEMYTNNNCIAVGWNQTSINANAWDNAGGYDETAGKSIPYNCLTMNDHYWIFDEECFRKDLKK